MDLMGPNQGDEHLQGVPKVTWRGISALEAPA